MSTIPTNRRIPWGQLLMTRRVADAIHPEDMFKALFRHRNGDWGDIGDADRKLNEQALNEDGRLFSAYVDRYGTKFWIVTEFLGVASRILLPEDY